MKKFIQSTTTHRLDTDVLSTDIGEDNSENIRKRITEMVELALRTKRVSTTDASEEQNFANLPNPSFRTSTSNNPFYVVDFPPLQQSPVPPKVTLHALQEWEGYIVDVRDNDFVVRLIDLTAGRSYESEEAVIPLTNISENDVSHLVIGSIFRWVIGYERSVEGTRKLVSHIFFRDLSRMTEADLKRGQDWMQSIMSVFVSY